MKQFVTLFLGVLSAALIVAIVSGCRGSSKKETEQIRIILLSHASMANLTRHDLTQGADSLNAEYFGNESRAALNVAKRFEYYLSLDRLDQDQARSAARDYFDSSRDIIRFT